MVDNQWILPYNPWLLRELDCDIKVEICTSIKSIKYVLKYVHKGNDQAIFQIQNDTENYEIKNCVNVRSIGSTEAAWRFFSTFNSWTFTKCCSPGSPSSKRTENLLYGWNCTWCSKKRPPPPLKEKKTLLLQDFFRFVERTPVLCFHFVVYWFSKILHTRYFK